MKFKKIGLLSIFFIFMFFFGAFENIKAKNELPIYIEGIQEREIKSVALSDLYNVDILTKSSSTTQDKVNEYLTEQSKNLESSLELKETDKIDIKNEVLSSSSKLFSKKSFYKNKEEGLDENNALNLLYGGIIIFLSLIGFLGALALRKKRGQNNVRYNHT